VEKYRSAESMSNSQRSMAILEVVGDYINLHQQGKELIGCCPLHDDRHPSLRVNPDKGVWYCPVCNVGGDALRFIELIEGVDFKSALTHLGLADQPKATRAEIKKLERVRRVSRNLAAWALALSERIGTQMREIGNRAHVAQKVLRELAGADKRLLQATIERATREWEILSTLEEDLHDPKQTATLWEDRETIERLVGDSRTYSNEDIENMYPPITDDYKQRLAGCVRGEG